jgi:hypothetical protein
MENSSNKIRISTELQDPMSHTFADPFICLVEKKMPVRFIAADTKVSILIANADAFFETDNYYWEVNIDPQQETKTPPVKSSLEVGKEHSYYIFCHRIDKFAWDPHKSPPKIKIRG